MTFKQWWDYHKQVGLCVCEGSCLYKIYNQQESWIDDKVKKRLKQDLYITDESQEYPNAVRQPTYVQSESKY